jgi:hypothetical protein
MSYKKDNNSTAIMVSVSVIALVLASMSGFNHSYTAFAAPKKGGSSSTGHTNGVTTLGGGGSSSSSSAATTSPNNSNVLTKKELSSFTSCIKTANSSQGLTHKIVTGCLDTARGITPASSSSSTIATSSSPSSIAYSTTSKS